MARVASKSRADCGDSQLLKKGLRVYCKERSDNEHQ